MRRDGSLRVRTPCVAGLEYWCIEKLFVQGAKVWNVGLVETIFSEDDAKAILSIPIRQEQGRDSRIWHYNKSWKYSVKSGYHVLMERVASMTHLHVSGQWEDLWQLPIPPRMSVMMWRVDRDVLPTRERLVRRGIRVPDSCGLCNTYSETLWHLFVHCEYVVECWRKAGLWADIDRLAGEAESIQEWLFGVFCHLPEQKIQVVVAIIGGLWRERNERVWSAASKPAFVTVWGAMDEAREWDTARDGTHGHANHTRRDVCGIWHPPPVGKVKCNVDDAIFERDETYGAGMVSGESNPISGSTKSW
ncbi:hypothetical protein LINPERHAP2_LOCUS37267 [Linum perenne]